MSYDFVGSNPTFAIGMTIRVLKPYQIVSTRLSVDNKAD